MNEILTGLFKNSAACISIDLGVIKGYILAGIILSKICKLNEDEIILFHLTCCKLQVLYIILRRTKFTYS